LKYQDYGLNLAVGNNIVSVYTLLCNSFGLFTVLLLKITLNSWTS